MLAYLLFTQYHRLSSSDTFFASLQIAINFKLFLHEHQRLILVIHSLESIKKGRRLQAIDYFFNVIFPQLTANRQIDRMESSNFLAIYNKYVRDPFLNVTNFLKICLEIDTKLSRDRGTDVFQNLPEATKMKGAPFATKNFEPCLMPYFSKALTIKSFHTERMRLIDVIPFFEQHAPVLVIAVSSIICGRCFTFLFQF